MTGKYTKSKKADHDIAKITTRSFEDFGEQQTLKYMAGLADFLQILAALLPSGVVQILIWQFERMSLEFRRLLALEKSSMQNGRKQKRSGLIALIKKLRFCNEENSNYSKE